MKNMRDIFVSRFVTFTDDFWFDNNKSWGKIEVNTNDETISFMHESGDIPTLYVLLMIMSINKRWLKIVDNTQSTLDMSRHFLLTRWLNFDSADHYLCHDGDDGVTVIDRCLVKCEEGGGIIACTFSASDYLMLVEFDSRFGFSTPKSRLKVLREDYGFRYLK